MLGFVLCDVQQHLTRVQVEFFHLLNDIYSTNVTLHFQMMTLRLNKLCNPILGLIRWLSLGFMSLNLNTPLSGYRSAHCFLWPIILQTGCHGILITSFSAGLRCGYITTGEHFVSRHQGEEVNSYCDSTLPSPEKSDFWSVAKNQNKSQQRAVSDHMGSIFLFITDQ